MRIQTFIIYILVFSIVNCSEYLITKEFSDYNFSKDQIQGWDVNYNSNNNLISECEQLTLFGGDNAFGKQAIAQKTYFSAVNHYQLKISFDLYAIDSWDDEIFYLYVDDILVYQKSSTSGVSNGRRQISCGNQSIGFEDKLIDVSITIPHYKKQFRVRLTSNLDEDSNNESWGIRNLVIVANYLADNEKMLIQNQFEINQPLEAQLQQTQEWTVVSQKQQISDSKQLLTVCQNNPIFGLFNQSVVSKLVTNLPEHYALQISFRLYIMDKPQNDHVYISIDDQRFIFHRYQDSFTKESICGSSDYTDNVQDVILFIPHIRNWVEIKFFDNFTDPKDIESWGISNFKVEVAHQLNQGIQIVAQEFTENQFTQAEGWMDSKGNPLEDLIGKCELMNKSVYLGDNYRINFFQKKYQNLPVHSNIRIFFQVYASDTWDNDDFYVVVDHVYQQYVVAPQFLEDYYCDQTYISSIQNYLIELPHTTSTLNISFLYNNKDPKNTFGLRNLKIYSYLGFNTQILASEFNQSNFSLQNWTFNGEPQDVVSQCKKNQVIGGKPQPNQLQYIQKQYKGIPKHDFITVTLKIYFVGFWMKDSITINLDQVFVKQVSKKEAWDGGSKICGWEYNDYQEAYTFQVRFPHVSDSFFFELYSVLSEQNASWAFSDLVITYTQDSQMPQAYSPPLPVANGPCIQIFTSCGFKGEKLDICESIPNLKQKGWTSPVNSVYIPDGKYLKLFKQSNYQGEFTIFEKSDQCLKGEVFLLINKAFNIDVKKYENQTDQASYLKRQMFF